MNLNLLLSVLNTGVIKYPRESIIIAVGVFVGVVVFIGGYYLLTALSELAMGGEKE